MASAILDIPAKKSLIMLKSASQANDEQACYSKVYSETSVSIKRRWLYIYLLCPKLEHSLAPWSGPSYVLVPNNPKLPGEPGPWL